MTSPAIPPRSIAEIAADWAALDTRADDIKWQRGRLALEAHTIRELPALAERVGVEASTLDSYRRVAEAWPEPIPGQSFSWHQELQRVGRGGDLDYARALVAEGKTNVSAIRALHGKRDTRGSGEVRRGFGLMDSAQRAEIVREALADPEVAQAVAADRTTERTFDQARTEVARERAAARGYRVTPQRDLDPERAAETITAAHEIVKARIATRAAFSALADVVLDAELREGLTAEVDSLATWVEQLQRRIRGTDIDQGALDRLLDDPANHQ